jgi:hypothetical protein
VCVCAVCGGRGSIHFHFRFEALKLAIIDEGHNIAATLRE